MIHLKWLKRNFFALCCSFFLLFLLSQMDPISTILTKLIEPQEAKVLDINSSYKKDYNFYFVKNVNSFTPLSKGDLKNIFFTIVNSGWKNFTFYCPSEYTNCITDMKELSQNQNLLTHINNFVHPFLSFSNIRTSLSESGEINVEVEYLYNEEQIKEIDEKIDLYIKENIKEDMSVYDRIMNFHDYIINHTKYDVERNEKGDSKYLSYIAYGPLMQGYATCNGYTDVMAIFLEKLNIVNYKIATTPPLDSEVQGHVWNAVYVDNEWLHLDLTWDDPVSNDGKDYLQHKYFLVNNEELRKSDEGEVEVLEHLYDPSIYLEFQEKKDSSLDS